MPAEDGIGAKLALTNALKDSQLDIRYRAHQCPWNIYTSSDVVESKIKEVF